ncbi:hypothetical protein Tco_1523985 [Tanacetum coccineum]
MYTPLDFSAFVMNQLKVDTLTPELLAGLTFELMKGSCKSLMELEYFFEEVYKANTDQLDWHNPEGQQYPHDMRNPLPLIPNSRGRCVIPFDHFINNDLGESARDVYSKRRIIAVTKLEIVDWHNYKHLDWITVRRDDDKLYKFKESDFNRLQIQDIKDMLLLLVQGKLTNLTVEERLAFNVCLRMFTRSVVIQRRVEDLQLGVESFQKKLNLTKPDMYRPDLKRREAYITYSNPRDFIYQNKDKKNRLVRIDELHKFSDGTLNDVQTADMCTDNANISRKRTNTDTGTDKEPKVYYQWSKVNSKLDSGLVVPSFNPSDDPIASLNKAMAFLSTTFASRFPQTNNQLRTSSNPRNQATIQDRKVTVQLMGYSVFQLSNLREIPTPAAFQTNDLDPFYSDCDDCSEQPSFDNDTKVDITSNSNIISYEQYLQETENLVVKSTSSSAQQDELLTVVIEEMSSQVAKCNKVYQENLIVNDTLTAELERYKEQVKLFEQRQKFDLNDREKYIDGQLRKVIADRMQRNKIQTPSISFYLPRKNPDNGRDVKQIGVHELLKVINNVPMIDCDVKGVTTRGGKTTLQDVHDNDTNVLPKEPLVVELEKQVGSNEVLTNDQLRWIVDNSNLGASIQLYALTRMYKRPWGGRNQKATRMVWNLQDRSPGIAANEESDSFLSRGLEKSIDQSDLECCEFASSNENDGSDSKNSIQRIDYANTPYPVTQGTTKHDDVKSEHLYSASANEIDEKKPELKNLPQHLEYAYLHGDKSFPIIISSELSEKEKISLLQVLEK